MLRKGKLISLLVEVNDVLSSNYLFLQLINLRVH